jgi:hypothetical protein
LILQLFGYRKEGQEDVGGFASMTTLLPRREAVK